MSKNGAIEILVIIINTIIIIIVVVVVCYVAGLFINKLILLGHL